MYYVCTNCSGSQSAIEHFLLVLCTILETKCVSILPLILSTKIAHNKVTEHITYILHLFIV